MNLYLMVGISGSGKSTRAKEIAAETGAVLLSSDEIRGFVNGCQSIQKNGNLVFKFLRHSTEFFLANGRSVIVDATNLDKKSRKSFLEIANKYSAETVAVCMNTDLETCIKQNNLRERKVPEEVIRRQFAKLYFPLSGDFEFDEIIVDFGTKLSKVAA